MGPDGPGRAPPDTPVGLVEVRSLLVLAMVVTAVPDVPWRLRPYTQGVVGVPCRPALRRLRPAGLAEFVPLRRPLFSARPSYGHALRAVTET